MIDGRDSVSVRRQKEREKAREKYGERGLLLAGDPDLDVFDFAINELVGLIRYGEMISARALALPIETARDLRSELLAFGNELSWFGYENGQQLIELRLRLLDAGFDLGKPEER